MTSLLVCLLSCLCCCSCCCSSCCYYVSWHSSHLPFEHFNYICAGQRKLGPQRGLLVFPGSWLDELVPSAATPTLCCQANWITHNGSQASTEQNRTGQDRKGVGAWLGKHMVSEFDGQQLCEFAFDSHKYALKLIRKLYEYNALLLISYPLAATPPLCILFPSHNIPFRIILLARLNFIHIIHKMLFNLQPCLIKLPICSAKQCEQCVCKCASVCVRLPVKQCCTALRCLLSPCCANLCAFLFCLFLFLCAALKKCCILCGGSGKSKWNF